MKPIRLLFLGCILVSGLAGCGGPKTLWADLQYDRRANDINDPDFRDDRYMYELASRFGVMAHFADVVYRDDLRVTRKIKGDDGYLVSEEVLSEDLASACDYLSADVPLPEYGMPYNADPDPERAGYWERWRGSKKVAAVPCINQEGLFYETYVYISNGVITEAVIAFRGTENSGSQLWLDWKTNLTGALGLEPPQYRLAARHIPELVRALKEENADIRIYAVGHSLGGGLAQQAGYLSRDVLEVFTFNTSPVTNWTTLALNGKVDKKYPIIHRIYNGGEVLGGIRSVSTLFTKARYGRHDIGIQIKPKRLLSGHSMTLLSCHLACLVDNQGDGALHGFSLPYIREQLIAEGAHCDGYVEPDKCDLTE